MAKLMILPLLAAQAGEIVFWAVIVLLSLVVLFVSDGIGKQKIEQLLRRGLRLVVGQPRSFIGLDDTIER